MTDLLITGTVAFDTIETPFGMVEGALGGSASYASYAASFFSKPALISVVGKDFPQGYLDLFRKRGIRLDGLKIDDKTFHWSGYYEYDMNEAHTKKTELNALENFKVQMPEGLRKVKYVFLGNIDPDNQMEVLSQISKPQLIVMDTMNFWISGKRKSLMEVIKRADVLLLNDGEARQLFETVSLVKAANQALEIGLKAVIIKKGEHGALLFTKDRIFNAPSYPLEDIKDPTGCGDCFGGGFVGYLAKTKDLGEMNLRKAVIYGSVIASFNAEDFSLNRLKTLRMEEIESRFNHMKEIREF